MTHGIPEAGPLQLSGEVNIFTAAAIREQLLARLETSPRLEIDLAEVSEIDTAGLQLLLAAKLTCQSKGGDLTLVHHSAPVLDVMDLCNLTHVFGDPVVISSN
ncbi:STAS domain-containing protein [Leeia oryzae]|uniref:STAS domain-containing protein n=1 Tax=Leeia oryzae TaxID=356662 RepID=UPI00037819EB|nr:STAS domain-containing protein [Leeia oryzae]